MSVGIGMEGALLEVDRYGSGPPLLFLHGDCGTMFEMPLISALAAEFDVHVPRHPGWGATRPVSPLATIPDLAEHYAEYIVRIGTPAAIVGVSVGAWIAAQYVATAAAQPEHLVLVSPIGVKVGARDERTFTDIYVLSKPDFVRTMYSDSSAIERFRGLDDDAYLALARAEEAMALYCWQPYMHDPKLPSRLHRIRSKTLIVHGASDRFVLAADYFQRYAELVGANAACVAVPGAGHRLDEENPQAVARIVMDFVARPSTRPE